MDYPPAPAPSYSSDYYDCTFCGRSLPKTIIGAFTMFVLFCTQLRAIQKSHYAIERKRPWFAVPGAAEGFVGKYLLPLLDPYMALLLSGKTSASASEVERSLVDRHELYRSKLDTTEPGYNWSTNSFFDPRSVRVLIGAQVYLSVPVEDSITSQVDYTCIKVEGAQDNLYSSDRISLLHIYPPLLLNSPPQGTTFTFTRCTLIPLNQAGKEALLGLGFVPLYSHLGHLRKKNTWETAIVAFNAFGYLLSTISRVYSIYLVSPLEALASYVAMLILLQSFSEFFFGGSSPMFKQALVIHLTSDQLEKVRTTAASNRSTGTSKTTKFSKVLFLYLRYKLPKVFLFFVSVTLFIVAAFAYLINSYGQQWVNDYTGTTCTGCKFPIVMVVFVNLGIFVVVAILACLVKGGATFVWIGRTWLVSASLITAAAWILATYDTCYHWKNMVFDSITPPNSYGDIIPYLG